MHLLRRTLFATTLALGLATGATADDRITVMLRSGEKLAGRYDGFANGQFYLDTDAEDRRIPLGDIALIDLTGGASGMPESELSQARGATHLLVTRDGGTSKGNLVRFEGSRVNEGSDIAYVVFRTESGEERRVAMRDVARVYLGNFPGGAPGTATTQPTNPNAPAQTVGGETAIALPANVQWIDTGLTVRQGQALTITATGEITLSGNPNDKANPNGALDGHRTASAPLPQTLAGALIGRIGSGQPFGIGAGPASIAAPATGRLFLGINDDVMGDNTGQFTVKVSGAGTNAPTSSRRRRS